MEMETNDGRDFPQCVTTDDNVFQEHVAMLKRKFAKTLRRIDANEIKLESIEAVNNLGLENVEDPDDKEKLDELRNVVRKFHADIMEARNKKIEIELAPRCKPVNVKVKSSNHQNSISK